MQSICPNNATIYDFDKNNPIKLTVNAGETIEISTLDCFSNQVDEQNSLSGIDWNHINPATGPIYVKDAKAGDILKVIIHSIELAETGVIAVGPGFGIMPFEAIAQKIVKVDQNIAHFSDDIKIPLNPMIGVIGVAPAGDAIPTGTPDSHGGNMDTKLITAGSILYLPIAVDGALFALGDLHAAMGDGEVGGTGIEIAGKVTVTLDVIHDQSIPHPIIETKDAFAFIVSKPTIDEAIQLATKLAIEAIHRSTKLSLHESAMLASIAGNAEISQLVDPLLTARFVVPKSILPQLL
ncbi:acetamidase/formamidase family protein [Wohlfahrtiimonas populi]|uniref:acetamidase/formamidase family protein n=1 Tax=Wohlfahrtiimonas populi TaxID=1940240 RepID=UPI00098D21B1|nr:acetamidase/formamidase family protein [Wohlfahrtiimonas populi]